MLIREEGFSGIIGPGRTSEGKGSHTLKCRNFINTDDVRTKMIGNIKYLEGDVITLHKVLILRVMRLPARVYFWPIIHGLAWTTYFKEKSFHFGASVVDAQWICTASSASFANTVSTAEQYVSCTRQATFLLLLDTINIQINLLVIKTNMASDQSRLQYWSFIPPDQIFVLLTVHNNIVVFFGKVNVICLVGRRVGPLTIRHAFVRA